MFDNLVGSRSFCGWFAPPSKRKTTFSQEMHCLQSTPVERGQVQFKLSLLHFKEAIRFGGLFVWVVFWAVLGIIYTIIEIWGSTKLS
ncbi:MAG: hypothetical protein ACJAZW_003020 [Maritalea sp.]